MKKLEIAWRENVLRVRPGQKCPRIPPSLARMHLARERRVARSMTRRVRKYLEPSISALGIVWPSLPTPSPSTSGPTTPPETSDESSSTISPRPEAGTWSSPTHEDPPNEWMERQPPPRAALYSQGDLEAMTRDELRVLARDNKLTGYGKLRKAELVEALLKVK